jgi:hypothetical protein
VNRENSVNRDALLETFAAELTLAAYCVAHRTRSQGTWLDLELGLWTALAEKVKTWWPDLSLEAFIEKPEARLGMSTRRSTTS